MIPADKISERVKELIQLLQLCPHPEGGHYKETHRSGKNVKLTDGQSRNAMTDIYFLLTAHECSRFHRVPYDEVWHYYEGDPVLLIEIEPETHGFTRTILGNNGDVTRYKHCVKGGHWQAACSAGSYSLAGCTVAPGFEFSDLTFLTDEEALCSIILEKYPEFSDWM